MSEHRASFTPSQVADLGKADLVFIVGHGLEAKLAQISGSEAVNGKSFVELSEAPGIKTLPIREGGTWEAHDHAHEDEKEEAGHDDHAEGVLAFDPHVWLDPENAKAMAAAVAMELAKADPANAAAYQANAKAFEASLDAVTAEITAELAPVKDEALHRLPRRLSVFRDAFRPRGSRLDCGCFRQGAFRPAP